MAQPFFFEDRGAGYRKPTTRQCLEREAQLLALVDPLNIKSSSLTFDWNTVFIIYRHKGTVAMHAQCRSSLHRSWQRFTA